MKKFGIHPLFLLLGIALVVIGLGYVFLIYLLVVILHELAHSFVAKKLGYNLDKIFLMPYGAGIKLEQKFVDEKDEIIIAISGPLFNLILVFLTISLWWLFPVTYNFTQEFVFANIITALLNFLPCYPLDGGRILTAYLSKKLNNKKTALKICGYFNYLIVLIFIIIFLINIFNNFTFLIMSIFIFLGNFDSKLLGKYEITNFPLFINTLRQKDCENVNIIGVSGNTEIYKTAKYLKKNKYNLIYLFLQNGKIKIINEFTLEKLFIEFNTTKKFNEIIN